jgi:hypothetical protein
VDNSHLDYHPGYACNTTVDSLPFFQGWVNLAQGGDCNTSYWVWRWTGVAWQAATLPAQTRVYVYPFAVGWSWIWTPSTGWVAARDHYLVVNLEVIHTGMPARPCGPSPILT